MPLFAADLAGVIFRRPWGQMTAMAASACWVYMFLVYAAQRYALVFRGRMGTGSGYSGILATGPKNGNRSHDGNSR